MRHGHEHVFGAGIEIQQRDLEGFFYDAAGVGVERFTTGIHERWRDPEFSCQLLVGEHQKARGIAAQDIRLQGIESIDDGLQRAVYLEDLRTVQELQQ